MSEHQPPIVRRCDVAVVGGSAAGLAAALQLQRQRRSVIVLDSGDPRNAPAAHMHGYLGYDGAAPAELVATGRAEVRRYGGEVLPARVTTVTRTEDGGFRLDAGHAAVEARRVVAATGIVDELPPVEGLDRHWGDTVIHCPFCHGYEVRDRTLVHLVTAPWALHPAALFVHLAGELTLVVAPGLDVGGEELDALVRAGAVVVDGEAVRVVEAADGSLTGVALADGSTLPADTIVVSPGVRPRIDPFVDLGLTTELHPSGIAQHVATSPMGETAVEGLYAAGNLVDPSHQVLHAAADGSRVGAMVALSLASEDNAAGGGPSSGRREWETRYAGDQVWSGRPNGTLVDEVGDAAPQRALDVGAGEGGDALWLAEQGWEVTAADVAESGLGRLEQAAAERDLKVRTLRADVNDLDPFQGETYDLVSLFYSAIPRTGDDRAVTNLLGAVGPGGTLLMVGHAPHDHGDQHQGRNDHDDDGEEAGRPAPPWDRDSYEGVDRVEAALRSTSGWTVVTSEVRARPEGSASHSHHHEDVVLRAVRSGG
ncbi:MAG: bifunctional NAD(P)/FAD-dependent oxidoreductase/class I SAM-dependent methyltransferase [Actinomycetota bacterium]